MFCGVQKFCVQNALGILVILVEKAGLYLRIHVFPAERLALIRQQRLEAAKKREEEKAGAFWRNCEVFVCGLSIGLTSTMHLLTVGRICVDCSERSKEGRKSKMSESIA